MGFSRIPVYEGRIDNIVGVLITSDLIFQDKYKALRDIGRLDDLARQPIFVPESKPLQEMLEQFEQSSYNMAIIVDEYGGAIGVVTIEDILEECRLAKLKMNLIGEKCL